METFIIFLRSEAAPFIIVLVCIFTGFFCISWISRKNNRRIRAAALALGDNFYETGVPNTVWKKYAKSFPEYQRLLYALARSGDFSEENVRLFVDSFSNNSKAAHFVDEDEDTPENLHRHKDDESIGSWGYGQVGGDNGYWQSTQFNK